MNGIIKDLLNVNNDFEEHTENIRVPENGITSDKVPMSMLDFEIVIT
jgi:hypothetical protein